MLKTYDFKNRCQKSGQQAIIMRLATQDTE